MIVAESTGFRSVPMRSINPSPSRRAIMEVFVGRGGKASTSAASGEAAVGATPQHPNPAAGAGAATSGMPQPLDHTRRPSDAQAAARRAQTPPVRSARSRSPLVRPRPSGTPRASANGTATVVNLANFETLPPAPGVLTSPRSLAVCAENGIHPEELVPRSLAQFEAPGVPTNIAALRFEHYEARRQEKVALLRAGREARIYEEHQRTPRGSSAGAAGASTAVAVYQPPAPPRGAAVEAEAGVQPAAARAKVAIEKNAKRQLVYERALKMKADREAVALRRQLEQERRSIELQRQQEAERQQVVELRRLRYEDAREHVVHLQRQRDYATARRAQQVDAKVARPVDKFRLVAAKEQFMTPQLRAARRSASAGR